MKKLLFPRLNAVRVASVFFALLIFAVSFSNSIVEISAIMTILLLGIHVCVSSDRNAFLRTFFKNPATLSVLLFWLLLIPSVVTADIYVDKAVRALFSKWGEVLLIYVSALFLTSYYKNTKALVPLIIGGGLICVEGLVQKFTGTGFIRGFPLILRSGGNGYAVTATFNHYTDFASFLIPVFFVSAARVLDARTRRSRLIFGVLLLLIILNLFFTFSRAAWIAVFAGLSLAVLILRGRKREIAAGLMAVILLVSVSIPSVRERFMYIFAHGGDEDRFRMWSAAWQMFREFPFTGKGLGTFMAYVTQYKEIIPIYAHNCYLQILAETGMLGFCGFLTVIAVWLRTCVRYMLNNREDIIFTGLFCGVAAFMTAMFFGTQLYSLRLSILFWALLGISAGYAGFKSE